MSLGFLGLYFALFSVALVVRPYFALFSVALVVRPDGLKSFVHFTLPVLNAVAFTTLGARCAGATLRRVGRPRADSTPDRHDLAWRALHRARRGAAGRAHCFDTLPPGTVFGSYRVVPPVTVKDIEELPRHLDTFVIIDATTVTKSGGRSPASEW